MWTCYSGFCLVASLLLVSASGQSRERKHKPTVAHVEPLHVNVQSILTVPEKCAPGQALDRFGRCRKVYKRSAEDGCPYGQTLDEEGNCVDITEDPADKCVDGQQFDPTTGGCREVSDCGDGPCPELGDVMQQMKESPDGKTRSGKKSKKASERNWILILKKKKKLIKPFLKPKPHPPHHDHHHHPKPEPEEEEEEEEPEPGPEDFPDPPELRRYRSEICVEGEDGTTGKCIESSEVPAISGDDGQRATNGTGRPRKKSMDTQMKKVIRFLKVLRMRRRLNPHLGRLLQGTTEDPTRIPLDEKLRK